MGAGENRRYFGTSPRIPMRVPDDGNLPFPVSSQVLTPESAPRPKHVSVACLRASADFTEVGKRT